MKLLKFTALMLSLQLTLAAPLVRANTIVWESDKSLIDTVDYSNLGPYYWFANFDNSNAIANAATDDHEARNLPSWLHLESRPAYIGTDDSGANSDTTIRTGYSFVENAGAGVGGSTIGGQANFNTLTLPGGLTGKSGQVIDSLEGLNNTTSQLQIRVLDGAPAAFRIWVVTDNGSGANFNIQNRIRVSLRDTVGAPAYGGDSNTVEAEALPGGFRLIQSGSLPAANNGTADAWSFLLGDVTENDIVTVRPTGGTGFTNYAGFAGLVIQPIPEPASAALLLLGGIVGCGLAGRRRLRD